MLRYFLRKSAYGILVLFGVVTVVFFLFNLAPGDPVRNLAGESASEETLMNMRRKLDLDLPIGQRYLLYINDLSPLSLHNPAIKYSRIYLDDEKYSYFRIITPTENRTFVMKWPYFKRSFLSERNVSSILAEVIPGTVVLAVVSITLAMIIGLLLGVMAAMRKDTAFDRMVLVFSAIGMAGPSFFVAIIVAWIGAILWREQISLPVFPILFLSLYFIIRAIPTPIAIRTKVQSRWLTGLNFRFTAGILALWLIAEIFFPPVPFITSRIHLPGTGLNMTGSLYSVDVYRGSYLDLRNMILPVITLMIRPLAVIVQLTRASLMDVMQQDFIRTARAKGLNEREVMWRHALRNALNPVVTAVSGWFASLLAGAVFVEFVFGWKGLGQEMFNAIEKQDLPVVMGGVIVIASVFVFINILVDFIYGWIDPRVRV